MKNEHSYKSAKHRKWANNEQLLIKIAENFKLLEDQNQQLQNALISKVTKRDQQKILKLYSYKNWQEYMTWINEKLEESGELIPEQQEKSIKRVLSQILQEPDFQQSYTVDHKLQQQTRYQSKQTDSEILAIENARLRRQNIKLKSKLNQIRSLYSNQPYPSNLPRKY